MKYLLDTHTWIWWNVHPQQLSRRVKSIIMNTEKYDEMLLSAISLWEFCKLLEKKRLAISCNPQEWMGKAMDMPKLRIVPLTPAIAYRSTILPSPFPNDPADQIIIATARNEDAVILTKDQKILNYQQVRSEW